MAQQVARQALQLPGAHARCVHCHLELFPLALAFAPALTFRAVVPHLCRRSAAPVARRQALPPMAKAATKFSSSPKLAKTPGSPFILKNYAANVATGESHLPPLSRPHAVVVALLSRSLPHFSFPPQTVSSSTASITSPFCARISSVLSISTAESSGSPSIPTAQMKSFLTAAPGCGSAPK